MEEHPLVAEMARSRARVRGLILPAEAGGHSEGFFPRSTAMRLLMDPRVRGVSISLVASLASMFFRRRAARRQEGADYAQTLANLVAALRKRD